MRDAPSSVPMIDIWSSTQSSAMDAWSDVNAFLLTWPWCEERMVVEKHDVGGQETYSVGSLCAPRPAGKLGTFYEWPSGDPKTSLP